MTVEAQPPVTHRCEVAVVGLGLIGSGALRHLAASGTDAIGVGPAEPVALAAHAGAFASHYDSGRITRHLDPRWEWAVLAGRSIAGYADLEGDSGIVFHRPVGVVMAELDPGRIASTKANAEAMGVPVAVVEPGGTSPFGPLLAFPPDATLLCEDAPAGHVDPRRMLAANLAAAAAAGAGIVREEAAALAPEQGGGWRVTTASGRTVAAHRVVVAAGPHADEVLAGAVGADRVPTLEVRGETVVLATLDEAGQQRLAGLPSVLARLHHPIYADLYLVPPTDYPDGTIRLKLGATLRTARALPTALAKRTWMRGTAHTGELAELRSLLEQLVPGVDAVAWETRPCLITETPSGLPFIDHLAPGLVVAAGGNGYAAKSANAIGALAADLAATGTWPDRALEASSFEH